MYHATNQTVEHKETGREAQKAPEKKRSEAIRSVEQSSPFFSLNPADRPAWGVNRAFEPVYNTHFLRLSGVFKMNVQKNKK